MRMHSESEFVEIGRERANQEQEAITWAVDELENLVEEREFDVEPYLEQSERVLEGIPDRHRAEFRGFAEALSVSDDSLAVYMFALSDVTDELAEDDDPAHAHAHEGCTNFVVPASRTADGAPLLLKNRDISASGLRPQALVEYPPIGGDHGFISLSTCGSLFVYHGVNDAGLAAANTYVSADRDDRSEGEKTESGIIIRRILEGCSDVEEARKYIANLSIDLVQGLTVSLADESNSALLELDADAEVVREVDGTVLTRTNHFPSEGETDDESSRRRFARAEGLADALPNDVTVSDLFTVAADHRHGRSPDSICRHPNEADDAYHLSQSLTVSSMVYRGGERACYGLVGSPCQSGYSKYAMGDDHCDDVLSGASWLRQHCRQP